MRFPVTGPVHYTLTGEEAVELCGVVKPRVVVPIHYEGWKHFHEGRADVERALARAPDDLRRRVRWLPIGQPADLEA